MNWIMNFRNSMFTSPIIFEGVSLRFFEEVQAALQCLEEKDYCFLEVQK